MAFGLPKTNQRNMFSVEKFLACNAWRFLFIKWKHTALCTGVSLKTFTWCETCREATHKSLQEPSLVLMLLPQVSLDSPW